MNPKKMRKLLRDPKLFFKDMLHKRLPKKSNTVPTLVKKKGNYSYSVVAAVYGVEKYLDDFFKSLVNQTLDFKSHIQLVMVDDGSPDNSAEIIKKWQKKYPENIVYVKKENGGQASARNLGMNYVTGDWVAFIDSDDFVDAEYFLEVDRHIKKQNHELLYVSCNFIYFYEDKNQFSDSHPLKYRFIKESVIQISNKSLFHQLSVNSVFFNSKKLFEYGIKANENIKPVFEDGDFVARLNIVAEGEYISFLPNAKYYYRKRSDATSTLDKSIYDERRYGKILDDAHLNLLSLCEQKGGSVPVWLQNTLLYEIFWTLKIVLNHGHKLDFMTDDYKKTYKEKLRKVFSYIDDEVILKYSLAGCWFFHKVGILGYFKGAQPKFSICYIEAVDFHKKLACIKYFWHGEAPVERITVSSQEIFPVFSKSVRHEFLGDEFVCERRLWIPISDAPESLAIYLNEQESRITLSGKQYATGGVKCDQVLLNIKNSSINDKKINILAKPLRYQALNFKNKRIYGNSWVFMDRDTAADDNAEHLYRYVARNHPEINIFFILRKSSKDWMRLEKEGFKLLNFNSEEHHIALLNADFLISSHADEYVVNSLPRKDYGDILNYKFIFLQHGVTHNDLSKWLNLKNIDLFIAATADEFNSLANSGTKYKYGHKEIVLTGFPRHDHLFEMSLNINEEVKKKIVIMPTWRSSLMGNTVGLGNERKINEDFFESVYASSWRNFLHSADLKELADLFNAEIVFYPHANIDLYLDGFDIPSYVTIRRSSDSEGMQKTFVETEILITDYSSVAFEVAYLKKPVIYYQFDRDEVFSGKHTFEKGYFDYEIDGFGPVCTEMEEVVSSLEQYFLQPDGEVWGRYKEIAEKTFAFRDGKCCERTFEAVRQLREPAVMQEEEIIANLCQGANNALQKGFIQTAISRYQQCFDLTNAEKYVRSLVTILSKEKQYGRVLELYEAYGQQWSEDTIKQCLDAFVALGCYRYIKEVLDRNPDIEALLDYSESLLKYAASSKNTQMFDEIKKSLNPVSKHSMGILSRYLQRDWDGLRASMRFSFGESSLEHFDLFLQACFRTNCVEYAEQVFKEIFDEIEPALANVYAVRIKLAHGEFDEALKAYEVLGKNALDSLAMEDIDNWIKLRQYKKSNQRFSAENGLKLLRRFFDDSEVASLIVEQTNFSDLEDFERILEIFSDRAETTPPLIALSIFKRLVSLHRYEEADQFALNASYAAKSTSDRALITDFQKMNACALEMA